jgi:hypothetical protein
VALLVLLSAGLAACGGGETFAISNQPLGGKINGTPWAFVAGQTDAFLSGGSSDTFFANLFDQALTSPCTELQPPDSTRGLILSIPKAVGRYAITLELNQTFSYDDGTGTTQNDIATSGDLEVTELTATSLRGGVKMAFGANDVVDGQFELTICAQ